MDASISNDLFSPTMVVVWGILAAAVILVVRWRVNKHRSRQRRRDAARESRRQLDAWREGGAPPHHDAPRDSLPH